MNNTKSEGKNETKKDKGKKRFLDTAINWLKDYSKK